MKKIRNVSKDDDFPNMAIMNINVEEKNWKLFKYHSIFWWHEFF